MTPKAAAAKPRRELEVGVVAAVEGSERQGSPPRAYAAMPTTAMAATTMALRRHPKNLHLKTVLIHHRFRSQL